MLVLFQVNLYIWASNNYIFIINTMKRRDFLTNTALLGAGIPLGMSSAVMTSCTQQQSAGTAAKSYSPEELGMIQYSISLHSGRLRLFHHAPWSQ